MRSCHFLQILALLITKDARRRGRKRHRMEKMV
jgi:hypothetical protein